MLILDLVPMKPVFGTYEALQGTFMHPQHKKKITALSLQNRGSGREVKRQPKKHRLISWINVLFPSADSIKTSITQYQAA